MLEAEEVDVDYFTPSTSTSLAKLFTSNIQNEDALDNSSLKYNAPLPPHITTRLEEPKQTQYLFAGTVMAYEWLNNTHEFRGKLGFAILKILSSGVNKIVIYDSNKSTLSYLTILTNTEIKLNENVSISYYDNRQKFWSIYPSTSNLKEILEILRHLEVKLVSDEDSKIGAAAEIDNKNKKVVNINEEEKESDTDASINRKTKDSILKRMAFMGQSVLPPPHTVATQTSDSSDTNDSHSQVKVRHKPKPIHKKNTIEKKILETTRTVDSTSNETTADSAHKIQSKPFNNDHQTLSVTTPNDVRSIVSISNDESNMSLFISEQRVSNTELRINMNRVADKLDTLIDKVKAFDIIDNNATVGNTSNFQNDIIQKLLKEYERKIQKYEDFIKLKGFDCETLDFIKEYKCGTVHQTGSEENEKKLCQLEQLCMEKEKEILEIKDQLQLASKQCFQLKHEEGSYIKRIADLKHSVTMKENEIIDLNKKLNDSTRNNLQNIDSTNRLKEIMNNTYQAISVNFEEEEMYPGSSVKNIVGMVVKKTTIDSLKAFNNI